METDTMDAHGVTPTCVSAAAAAPRSSAESVQKISQKETTKKKRRLKVAPRFYQPDAYTSASPANAEANVALLRDVFTTATCRCFILKSFSDANFHKSLKYGVWTSTYAHNAVLDAVFQSEFSTLRPVLLFFSVCGSKHFNGIARMTSRVRIDLKFPLWEKPNKYDGLFHVEWLLVKDVPNFVLTDIKMSNTPTKKSITACRDCEEVMYEEANRFIEIFTEYPSTSSAWDDYTVFETQQIEMEVKRGLDGPVDPDEFVLSLM